MDDTKCHKFLNSKCYKFWDFGFYYIEQINHISLSSYFLCNKHTAFNILIKVLFNEAIISI